jgi:hypothetical protein
VADETGRLDDLLAIAEALARRPARELILVRLLRHERDLATANAGLGELRDALAERSVACRVAAYTTTEPGTDVARLATDQVDLVLMCASRELCESGHPDCDLGLILERVACDVAVLVGGGDLSAGPVVTPFGGVEHDWSAIEVAARLAASTEATLQLVGTEADAALGRRDASRLLARASLLVQQMVGIVTEPVLVRPGETGVLEAARGARLLVVGLSDRWRTEGVGPARLAVATGTAAPTLLVRRGRRPYGPAPAETLTRFTWTH